MSAEVDARSFRLNAPRHKNRQIPENLILDGLLTAVAAEREDKVKINVYILILLIGKVDVKMQLISK